MTTFLLIRHGETDANEKVLAGWTPGWHLNPRGKRQAENLAEKLAPVPLHAVYSSPLERAVETAEPIARRHRLLTHQLEELGELHFGDWEGKTFAELDGDENWRRYNASRGTVGPPGGEPMWDAQLRMSRLLECLAQKHPDERVALIGHGDPFRALIAHCLGIPLDLMLRFEISPGSFSILRAWPWGTHVLCMNHAEELPL